MAPPPPPPPPPDPPVMIDELVEEFLLRLPPEDPALLARAALVSRQWYHVLTGPSFRRRFCELRRSTPLLGYIVTLDDSIRFVPLSSFRPPRTHRHRGGVRAVSSSHGRVLLHRLFKKDLIPARYPVKNVDVHLSVWHPITDEQQDLPVVPLRPKRYKNIFGNRDGYRANWDAAIVCAVGNGCDHLHCHFLVVFMGTRKGRNFSCFYSSEAGSWSDPVFTEEENTFIQGNCFHIGTALYTTSPLSNKIFKYDLQTHQVCNIPITPGLDRPIATEDGRLGFAETIDSTLRLWVRENGRLEESRSIDLRTLLPAHAFPDPACVALHPPWVVAFAETEAGVVFLRTCIGYFTIDLKSGSCKKVGKYYSYRVVPFVSFCTPAPAAGVAISSDDVPVADIAVYTRDQDLLLWSLQMRAQDLLACVPKKLKLQVQGSLNQEGNE